jgi:dihydropteroate synthase
MTRYYRAIARLDVARPSSAVSVAGGPCWASRVEVLSRDKEPEIIAISDAPAEIVKSISAVRKPIAGVCLDQPRIMGIVNVTPDSFSDDGLYGAPEAAQASALSMINAGADIIDIGGESTRPGADTVASEDEISRTVPAIAALRKESDIPISIDTRKSQVAHKALSAGASMVNDVSGFTFDSDLAPICANYQTPVCVMHAKGDPATMQNAPYYDDVLLDVYDFLATQIDTLVKQGIARSRIIADPGIGFGKTQNHNLALLRRISLFHTLGCPILLGASRKRFIGTIGKAQRPVDRAPGSVAVGLAALSQGVQILRVHDVEITKQAIRLHNAMTNAAITSGGNDD